MNKTQHHFVLMIMIAIIVVMPTLLVGEVAAAGSATISTIRPNADVTPRGSDMQWYHHWARITPTTWYDWVIGSDSSRSFGTDSDYLRGQVSSGSTQKSLFQFQDVSFPSSDLINGVTIYYVAQGWQDTLSGAPSSIWNCFKPTLRIGAVDYYGPEFCPSFNVKQTYPYTFATNPSTGTFWTRSDVNTLRAGMIYVDKDGSSKYNAVLVDIVYAEVEHEHLGSN